MLPGATTARLLPEHVDISIVLTFSGLGALAATFVGVLLQLGRERLRRVALLGSMVGAMAGVVCWLLALMGALP